MSDIDDTINVGNALSLLGKRDGAAPMAARTVDDEPLVATFEFRGAEFICMVCGKLYGWLSPAQAPWTQELQDRHDELRARYLVERAEREAAAT